MNLLAKTNRGLLLDLIVFVANLFLMRMLTAQFIELFKQVSAENPLATFGLGLTFLAMWILPAIGAVLKRWHVHKRIKANEVAAPKETVLSGCLFNPIFYFCLNLVLTAAVLTGLGESLFGRRLLNNGAVFVPLISSG